MKNFLYHLRRLLPAFYLSLASMLIFSSCGLVTTSTPLGHPTEISATNLNGVWIQEADKNDTPEKGEEGEETTSGGVMIVKVTDPKKGELKILSVDSDTLETESMHFTVRKIGTILIGNMLDKDSKKWIPLLIEPIGDNQMAIRLFMASGIRDALGLPHPERKESKESELSGFVIQDDGLELSKTQKKQFETWLGKIPTDKTKRDNILEEITGEKEDRIILTHRIYNKEISQ